jgi:hypothetical protein
VDPGAVGRRGQEAAAAGCAEELPAEELPVDVLLLEDASLELEEELSAEEDAEPLGVEAPEVAESVE